ncbi:MAG: hypothetical protein Faunusvirus57_5 [Faunusvirus sp.]|jgi:hypothetical protein|uniref:Uncharacterized protein n=1 Tax=Faunusvirus sp. TaxID=2487766 RepID=A0A3G4ZY17_9VIRU|nr:MAG: hypothetical protein Faunusvirus57_5 [Faunusvirus sp.]
MEASEFIQLVEKRDEKACLEYIDKHDGFNDIIVDDALQRNMLQFVCTRELDNVAMALIDKKCDLQHQNIYGYTALMYASWNKLKNVTAYIIDRYTDTATRVTNCGSSEMMYICRRDDIENTIKMMECGYDIYYKNHKNETLFTLAVDRKLIPIMKKLIDIDTHFAQEFKTLHNDPHHEETGFDIDIMKYCHDKHDAYKREIIMLMNDASPTNALYQSFHTTYAVQLVDIICDFILLPI